MLWGLPASGKSHYASEQCPPRQRQTHVTDCDSITLRVKRYGKIEKVYEEVANDVLNHLHYSDHIIIDGLITSNDVADTIFKTITIDPRAASYDILFSIVWWSPDREACLRNDRGRRHRDSKITIENCPFEEPSQTLIEAWGMKKRVTRKRVVKKPDWKVWAQEVGAGSSDKLKGSSWSLGGTSGNCWNNELHRISAEPQPVSFAEFDSLLEEVCPQISFLQYKKLYNETVTTETSYDHDYYGGSTESACFVCDLPKLYDMLVQMEIIKRE